MLEALVILSFVSAPIVGVVMLIVWSNKTKSKRDYEKIVHKLYGYQKAMENYTSMKITLPVMEMYKNADRLWIELNSNSYYNRLVSKGEMNEGFSREQYMKNVFGKVMDF